MEFLLAALVLLIFLALGSIALVEGICLTGRLWSRWRYRARLRRLYGPSIKYRSASMKAYAQGKGNARPSLGQLRFTKSRAQQFAGPHEPPHGA